ncbi:phospholipase D/nuclease [Zalerion maritima]|uniref:Phospholipase D/nuclease n=1 Tax=Zalerion maritima TaxID=339359 RepID=A0AAD5RH54_9PEZI|nr:phospholipase D/nuclease [Zalerion maritima]
MLFLPIPTTPPIHASGIKASLLTGGNQFGFRGRLTMDAKSKTPKLSCRNWECGVVVPVLGNSTSTNGNQSATPSACTPSAVPASADENSKDGMSEHARHEQPQGRQQHHDGQPRPAVPELEVFQNTVPVPFEAPAARLDGGGSGLQQGVADDGGGGPWFFMEFS